MPKPPPPPRVKPAPRGPAKPAPPAPRGPARPAPPPAAKPTTEQLAEVERALSILHGRHPEAVRAERETQAALQTKKASSEAVAASVAKKEKRAWILRISAGAGLALAATALGSLYSRAAARGAAAEASLAPAIAPYAALGFSRVSGSRFARETLDLSVEEPTCFVALATALLVERPSGQLEGSDSIAWCTCGAERARVRLGTTASGGSLAVLHTPAAEVGGDHGLSFLNPRPKLIAAPDECGGASLDAWIDSGRAPVSPDDAALSEPLRGQLRRSGFATVGGAHGTSPFAVVPAPGETCLFAWSTVPTDVLSLRLPGGERPIADEKGSLGVCSEKPRTVTVWRKGAGEVVVVKVSASHIGGIHGLREASARLGFERMTGWVSADELAWDASSTLRASGVPPPEIAVSSDGNAVTHARVVALSIAGAMVRADAQGEVSACEPPLTRSSEDAVCVQSRPLAWHVVGAVGKAGIAEATLPFWMRVFATVTDPPAVAVELSVLKLGRRLVAEGFEATTLDGVTETREGAVVTGRAGDDEIVAVLLTREAPWAAPCSSEGEEWTLDAGPDHARGIVALAPGAQVKVVCGSRATESRDRKTVVFRHPAATDER